MTSEAEVEVINGDLAGCGLDGVRKDLKGKDRAERVIIFSYLFSGLILNSLVDWSSLLGRYYYDWKDELDLAFGLLGRYSYKVSEIKGRK